MLSLGQVRRLLPLAYLTATPFSAGAQPTARFEDPPAVSARPLAPPAREPWARSAAKSLLERAQRLEQRGDSADALRIYNEAIRMDPSFGPAYLAFGRLRHALRDYQEAERLFTAAARLPDSAAEALELRARVARDMGKHRESLSDLRAAVDLDPRAHHRLRTLARWYAEEKAWPAALGVWRRLAADLESAGETEELRQARIQIRALALLAGDADPVVAGRGHASWVRRSLARIAGQR